MPQAWLPPFIALFVLLLVRPSLAPFWYKGLRRSRGSGEHSTTFGCGQRRFILNRAIHIKPSPQVQKQIFQNKSTIVSGQKENKLQVFWLSHPHEENSRSFSFTHVLSRLSITVDYDGNHLECWTHNKAPAVAHEDMWTLVSTSRCSSSHSAGWGTQENQEMIWILCLSEPCLFGQPLNIIWNRKAKWNNNNNNNTQALIWCIWSITTKKFLEIPNLFFPWIVWFLCEWRGHVFFFLLFRLCDKSNVCYIL